MPDMLVRLYDLPDLSDLVRKLAAEGLDVRRAIAPEKNVVVDWVHGTFSQNWAAETDKAMANTPVSCFIAARGQTLLGFACYDATMRDFFGPIGVAESCRGKGTGRALLLACLLDMKLRGYGYAVIGSTHVFDFYRKTVGATLIPDSEPSIWKDMLRRPRPKA
jgi:hypothetical protein